MRNPQIFGGEYGRDVASSLLCNAPDRPGGGYRVLCQKVTRGGADVVEVVSLDLPGSCFGEVHAMLPASGSFLCVGHEFVSGAHYFIEWKRYGLTWSVSWWSGVVVGQRADESLFVYVGEVGKVGDAS